MVSILEPRVEVLDGRVDVMAKSCKPARQTTESENRNARCSISQLFFLQARVSTCSEEHEPPARAGADMPRFFIPYSVGPYILMVLIIQDYSTICSNYLHLDSLHSAKYVRIL